MNSATVDSDAMEIRASDRLEMDFHFREQIVDGTDVLHTSRSPPNWWKDVVVYQIWPASFKDSNGDGLGDLRGIISQLDHLKDLGADVIWLSPMYDSPQEDMGYDISDYNKIYPPYGTMHDMEELIRGLHDRGMKIILDLVVNHTSSENWWFKESQKSRNGPYADFYIWKDPKFGKDGQREPPNNWGGAFGGSVWEWGEERQQYYLHIFAKGQPDLNWESADVRKEIHQSALRFWLDKGVDGFRVDTCNIYSKDPLFRDGKVIPGKAPYGDASAGIVNGPRIHEYWQEIRTEVLDDFSDPLMVGELAESSTEETLKFIAREPRELSMVFDFTYAGGKNELPMHEVHGYDLPEAKKALKRSQDYVAHPSAWGSTFKENHDLPRSVSRFGSNLPKYWKSSAKLLAMMTATLSGTLYLYQGEEIGMTNIPLDWTINDCRDIATINYWNSMKNQYSNDKNMMAKAWQGIVNMSRDNARTPVQWSGDENAGFTTGKPWMRVNDNYATINVADQRKQHDSVLSFWKRLIRLRKEYPEIFVFGSYHVRDFDNRQTWTFEKRANEGNGKAWVVLNFSEHEAPIDLPKEHGELVLSNAADDTLSNRLRPFEGRVYLHTP